ncbi:MAG: PQQ-binding-like beta-propeller repeat protein [Chloroflexi bacterium]|nr:PQQ-binding-like beta-propeller repeat protein [Chloroflexota bacterium]
MAAPKQVWSVQVDGAVYAEPLVVGGRVYVATENDTVYALDAGSGAVVWQRHLGTPVPRSALPCGNIDPSGTTSTLAIDVQRNELYAVGRVTAGQPARVQHQLWVLDLDSGQPKYNLEVDPPNADPRYLQERGALALANGRVYVPFGGNFGDCGPYKGWVVSAKEGDATGAPLSFAVPTQREGAVWAPPGEVVDQNGDIVVATGNAESAGDFDYANAVIRLSPDLQMKDYWAPKDWQALSRSDTDIGSVAPTLLQNDLTFQIGKAGVGYLLKTDALGKIAGEAFQAKVCSAGFGGTAYQPPVIYVPCTNGLFALRIVPGAQPSFQAAWQVTGQQLNSPIVAYGSVWSIDTASGTLFQIAPVDGAVQNRLKLPTPVIAHFSTPSAAGGRILVGSGTNVVAFGS